MSTNETQPKGEPCGDCDLNAIEDLACSAQRFEKQAAVAKDSLPRLTGYKTSFATARADYQKARDAVQLDLAATKKKLKDVLDSIECKLNNTQEQCVRQSLTKVIDAIKACAGESGCCAGPCEFAGPAEDEGAAALAGRIDQYRRDVATSEKCFTDLIAEQTSIATRVQEIKTEVDAISVEVHADKENQNWALLYARALIVQWKLRAAQLWKGYITVNDFMDCLCTALRCALEGWETIALLEGRKAELDCQDAAKQAACIKKQEDMIGEVMSEYVKCCPPQDDDEDDDPGCHKKHTHEEDGGDSAPSSS